MPLRPTTTRRRRTRLRLLAATVVVLAGVGSAACGDGRPPFCADLARAADMSTLTKALEANDLEKARKASDEFEQLADEAPEDVRPDMDDLSEAVGDIVDLLGAERSALPGATSAGDATAQQDRDALNRRLEELSVTSSRVERWAVRTCGLDLT